MGVSDLLGIPKSLRSRVFLNTGNGTGSVNTFFRRFVNSIIRGTDLIYVDDPGLGGYVLVGRPGVYAISYTDGNATGGAPMGIVLNPWAADNQAPPGIPMSTSGTTLTRNLGYVNIPVNGQSASMSIIVDLEAGDRVYFVNGNGGPANDTRTVVMVTKVSEQ